MQPSKQTAPPQVESTLTLGNRALRDGSYAKAIDYYLNALQAKPELAKLLTGNMEIARKKYRAERDKAERQQVAVCGWELSHNSAGRVYTLAQLYQTFADVEIIGSLFARYGRELWEPIRNTTIPCHTFIVEEESRFLDQALALVAAHPYDIVHLSKPRISNILFGLLYKLIWGAKVLVDIDDEELAFVGADTSISLDEYLAANEKYPELKDLDGHDWTRISVGLAKEFDGITVSNPALQQRYGGQVIRHARDEKLYQPSPELKHKSREKFGIPQDKKVVLFFGTPREHKGLLETATAIAQLERKDVLFVIVGDFADQNLKDKLLAIQGVDYQFFGNQPFDSIPDVVAMGDICVLLQDPDSPVSKFQVPAKLSDALGMGLVVITQVLPALADINSNGILNYIGNKDLISVLSSLLSDSNHAVNSINSSAVNFFIHELSLAANAKRLEPYLLDLKSNELSNIFNQIIDRSTLSFRIKQFPISNERVISGKINDHFYKVVNNWQASQPKQQIVLNDFVESIDIVVPVYNALEDVKKCLISLQNFQDGFAVKVIVVNDGSNEETTAWLRSFCSTNPLFLLIEHEKNAGYTKAVNTGLRTSSATYVVTQNSDTIVTQGWLRGLVRCMNSDPLMGIVGPLSNAASWQNVPDLLDTQGAFAINELPNDMSPNDMAYIVSSVSARVYPKLPFVNGFCFMIKRAVIDAIGIMDEENFPVGYGEENDFCIRAADAGYFLAIADDVYVFHAKSKSFGHEQRKELSQQGSESLKRKHTKAKFDALVAKVKKTEPLDEVRKKVKEILFTSKNRISKLDIMSMRILFLLPVQGGGGGAHSVVQEVAEMRRLGLHAKIAVRHEQLDGFLNLYSDIPNPHKLFIGFEIMSVTDLAESYDIVVGTVFHSMALVNLVAQSNPHILPAYYVQDYEPLFFDPNTDNFKIARDSYKLVPNTFLFAKTEWLTKKVFDEHGVIVHKVEPSIDHEVYNPKSRHIDDRIHITAMIRPQTPRRGAERTMRIFSKLDKANPDRFYFHLFGCAEDSLDFKALDCDFNFKNYGVLKRLEVAALLARCDLFVDLSDYQAFGRTALEAMASGCAVIVPVQGGADEYAVNGVNALVVDSLNEDECFNSMHALLNIPSQLEHFKRAGLITASRYSVHRAAVSEWIAFADALSNHRLINPKQEKPKLTILPSVRGDGLPTGSGFVRVLLPYGSKYVRKNWQVNIHVSNKLPEPNADGVVVIQREAAAFSLDDLSIWIGQCKSLGCKIIYELDDDLIDSIGLKQRGFLGDTKALEEKVCWLAKNADQVTVSTLSLAEKVKPFNSKVVVVPNVIDSELWRLAVPRKHNIGDFPRQIKGPISIGYIGTPTHDQDLDIIVEAMQQIQAKYDNTVLIEVIGGFQRTTPKFGNRVGLPKKSDYPNFVDWLHARVNWDIGIIPLLNDDFNNSKSNLKFLEYAALGMAIVCSDVPSYSNVAVDGVNSLVIVNTTEAWVNALSTLIENIELRILLETNARELVAEKYTIESAKQIYLDVLSG